MRDLQNENTGFVHKAIQEVGVSGIRGIIPIVPCAALSLPSLYCEVEPRSNLHLLATFDAVCPLSAARRGLNMSRTARAIYGFLQERSSAGVTTLSPLALDLMTAHEAEGATVRAAFDYPMEVLSPVTHTPGVKCLLVMMQSEVASDNKSECSRHCEAHSTEATSLKQNGTICRDYLTVTTSETSLCPCSKLMSMDESGLGRGAHNQIVDITAWVELVPLADPLSSSASSRHYKGDERLDEISPQSSPLSLSQVSPSSDLSMLSRTIETIYHILSSCASAPTYPVLRRPDEKAVTEHAWDNPRFVEDIVRLAAEGLDSDPRILHYTVTAASHESIHSDGIIAVAKISDE